MTPNWTDDDGRDWFNKLECKRCLHVFDAVDGEVPEHDCIGSRWKSESKDGEHHTPIQVEVIG